MVLIQCQTRKEAQPIIRYFRLMYDSSFKSYPVYSKQEMALIISGAGAFCACSASSYLLSRYEEQIKNLLYIHIGLAGSFDTSFETGEMVIGNKVTSTLGKSGYYPDLLMKTHLKEAHIVSLNNFPSKVTPDLIDAVYDIGAYGFSESAFSFLGPHQIIVAKIISSPYKERHPLPSFATDELLFNKLEYLDLLIHKYFFDRDSCLSLQQSTAELLKLHRHLVEHLKLSETLSIELKKHLSWSFKAHLHHDSVTQSLKQVDRIVEETLHSRVLSKKEGIREYKRLKDQLLSF